MKTSRLHSDKIRKYTTINHLQLMERASGFTGESVDRLKAFRVNVTNPLPDPGVALDAMEPINAFMLVMENYRKQNLPDGFAQYLGVVYNEFLGYYLDCLEWIMHSKKPVIAEDVESEIWKFRAEQAVKKFKQPREDRTNEALLQVSDVLLKDDPAFTYLRSSRNLPYRIHKFILEKKIKATDAAVAICREFSGQWKDLENQMEQMRQKNITDDASWNDIFSKKDKLIERWKTSLSAL